jgi:hypothetical protein
MLNFVLPPCSYLCSKVCACIVKPLCGQALTSKLIKLALIDRGEALLPADMKRTSSGASQVSFSTVHSAMSDFARLPSQEVTLEAPPPTPDPCLRPPTLRCR